MSTSISHLAGDFYSRRLLLHTTASSAASPPSAAVPGPSLNTNVIMVLSVLVCALICALGINLLVRCTMRCSALLSDHSGGAATAAVKTGLRRKAVKAFATVRYSPETELPGLGTECVICLSDFAAGERLRLLPKCHHGFHVRCIDKWLGAHSTCPTCRDCLVETCEKIAGAAAVPVTFEEVPIVIIISPVEPEGYIRNYRETSEACV